MSGRFYGNGPEIAGEMSETFTYLVTNLKELNCSSYFLLVLTFLPQFTSNCTVVPSLLIRLETEGIYDLLISLLILSAELLRSRQGEDGHSQTVQCRAM